MNYNFLWDKLVFNARNSLENAVPNINWRILRDGTSPLVYKNPRYKSVAVHAAKQLLMSELEGELNKIIPKFKKNYEKSLRGKVLAQQQSNYRELINNQTVQSNNWGSVTTPEGKTIIAKDKYGTSVREALMLYYNDETSHIVEDVDYVDGSATKTSYSTTTVCHIDLAPQVSMNSSKNLVMTQVQGRDYTRKELVSGGDLQFSISGNIVSDEMGVYPTNAVRKFVQIMEYNGILNVNFMMFEPFNVKKVIIKDYSLDKQTYKNMQPYTFNCVAVESDDEVKVQTDTISVINKQLELSPMNKWYKLILENKMASMAVSSLASSASSTIITTTSMGLDELTTHI